MIRFFLVALSAVVMSNSAFAAEAKKADRLVSGNTLYGHCSSQPSTAAYTTSVAYCVGYVTAVSDTFNTMRAAENKSQVICLPASSNAGQMADIVAKYLGDNPSTRHFGATTLVLDALVRAFPCQAR
jgi:hypothetical protein